MADTLRPFEGFAFYYDSFMANLVDYRGWVDYALHIGQSAFRPPHSAYQIKTILDLACGTGIPTLILLEKGFSVTGLDASPEMLSVLEKKAKEKGVSHRLKIILADMKDFRTEETFDACFSFYDSLNYLLTEEDLKGCFRSVFSSLKEGGIFAFDMNTIFCLETIWDNHSFWRESKELLTLWQNEYDKEKKISTLYLKCWVKGPKGSFLHSFFEIHKERGYELETIENLLREAGFSGTKFFQHLTLEKPKPKTTRVMIVAIK
jgi:SAM-dependent methyltransferase